MSFAAGIKHSRQTAAQAGTVPGCNFRAGHSWQHDDEFIAADTSPDIGLPEITSDGPAHFPKDRVTKEVAEGVIDGLKIVGIDNEQGDRVFFRTQLAQGRTDLLLGCSFTEQAREFIDTGPAVYPLLP